MPDPFIAPTAHGITVTFGGVAIGRVIGFAEDYSSGQTYDATGRGAVLRGSGTNVRVQRQISITMIDPGTITFRVHGNPVYGRNDIGLKATLSFLIGGIATAATAILDDVQREGERGGLLQSLFVFRWEGST